MATAGSFAKWVRPSVPGCPEVMILEVIKQAAIEFCTRTKILYEDVVVPVQAGIENYALDITETYEPIEILFVKRSYAALIPSDRREHDLNNSPASNPKYFYMDALQHLVLYPTPVGAETLSASVAVTPSDSSTTLPDELLIGQRYLAIAAGAKSRLMMMENVPWANMQNGAIERAAFDSAISAEQVKRAKGSSTKRLRTKLNLF